MNMDILTRVDPSLCHPAWIGGCRVFVRGASGRLYAICSNAERMVITDPRYSIHDVVESVDGRDIVPTPFDHADHFREAKRYLEDC